MNKVKGLVKTNKQDNDIALHEDRNANNSTTVNMNGNKQTFIQHAETVIIQKIDKELLIRIILITLPIIVFLTIGAILIYRHHQFTSYYNEGQVKYENANYIEAAELADKAYSFALTNYEKIMALSKKGTCYLAESSNEAYNNETKTEYIQNALGVFNSIVSTPKNKGNFYYYDAVNGMSSCYYLLNYQPNNKQWIYVIDILEKRVEKMDTGSKMNSEEITQIGLSYVNLLAYYQKLHQFSESLANDNTLNNKIIHCYARAIAFYSKTEEIYYGQYDVDNIMTLTAAQIDSSIIPAIESKQPTKELSELINSLESVLESNKQGGSNLSPNTIFHMNYVLGKCYLCLSVASTNNDVRNTYIEKSYEILSPLLKAPYTYGGNINPNVGYFCAMTCRCTEEDIEQTISNYKSYLSTINKETEVEKYIHDSLAFLSSCKLIKYIYPYHDKSDSFAINLIEHLKQYEPYLTNNDSKRIDDYNIYFRTNEGDTTSEEQIYNWFKPKEV